MSTIWPLTWEKILSARLLPVIERSRLEGSDSVLAKVLSLVLVLLGLLHLLPLFLGHATRNVLHGHTIVVLCVDRQRRSRERGRRGEGGSLRNGKKGHGCGDERLHFTRLLIVDLKERL